MFKKTVFLCLTTCLLAVPLWAGNGHYLHGVGAVNSSMGGAGTGLAIEVIGALHANPALLTELEDQVSLGAEAFVDDLSMTTTFPEEAFPGDPPPGINKQFPDRHTTESDGDLGVLPALGFSYRINPNNNLTLGWGLLAVAGFRTNWPADPESALLAPQGTAVTGGFGRLQTELSVAKLPFALAWSVGREKNLSLGVSLDLFQSRLNIQPLPVVPPDCNGGPIGDNDPAGLAWECFRPSVSVPVTEWAIGLQLGLLYKFGPENGAGDKKWSLGLSYTTEQDYEPFVWQSQRANPNRADFGEPRDISISLDQPAIASFGLGFRPSGKVKLALDARWVGYNSQDGIGGTGGISNKLELISIGWRDIWIGMLGVEVTPGSGAVKSYRFGLNFNQSPIIDRLTLNSGGTPSVFEEHYTAGVTFNVKNKFDLNLGAYYTPSNSKTGPFQNAQNSGLPLFIDGTEITLTNEILAGLVSLAFYF